MAAKRQTVRETKARGKALAKQARAELLAPVDHQRYTVAESADLAKLESNSTSPDLSASIKLVRALIQQGIDDNAPARQQAELLRLFHNLARTEAAIVLQLAILIENKSLADLVAVVVDITRKALKREKADVEGGITYLESELQQIINQSNLVKVNAPDAVAKIESDQSYDLGDKQPTYDQAASTLDCGSELQLCRWYIQRCITDNADIGTIVLLVKQEIQLALSQIQFGKFSGALINREAARKVTLDIVACMSECLRLHVEDFDHAIDWAREQVMQRFQPQLEKQ